MNEGQDPNGHAPAGTTGAEAGASAAFRERLLREQLVVLNRQGRVSNLVPPVNAVILSWLLWNEVSNTALMFWVIVVWLNAFARLAMYRQFDAAVARGGGGTRDWAWVCVVAYTVSGAIWGFGSVAVYPEGNFLLQALLIIFVLGMAAGGAVSFAAYMPALAGYLLPLTLPLAVFLTADADPVYTILGIAGVVFVLALLLLGRAGNRSLIESIRLGVVNEGLVQGLERTQRRLEDALDSMAEAFALFDREDRLVEFNDNFRRLLPAFERDLSVGLGYAAFVRMFADRGLVPDAFGQAEEWAQEMVRRHRAGEMPVDLRLVDGRWLLLNERRTNDGGTVSLLSDITDLKRREAELVMSEQRFRDFTTAASDWAWETDANGRFRSVSGRYTEVSGNPTDFLIGQRLLEQPSTGSESEWEKLVQAIESHRPFRNIRVNRARGDGDPFHFLLSGVPIFDDDGVFAGFRGTGSDITAIVAAEDRAREAQARLFDAIESIPASFVLFDDRDRLVLWNSRAPDFFPGASRMIVAGTTYQAIMRACAESGSILDAEDRIEDWIGECSRWIRNPERRREIRLADGRFVHALGRRTADGGTVCVMTDITDIRLGQQELAEKTTQLQATLEGMG